MNGNVVKLVFQAIAAGSGFAKITAQTAELQRKLGKLSQGAQILGRAFGNIGGVVGRGLGMLLQGGIWGAAAEGAVFAIGKIVDGVRRHNQLLKDARLAARGLSRDWNSVERAHAGYLRRVEAWRKAADEAKRAEADAAAKAKEAAEKKEAMNRRGFEYTRKYYTLEAAIAAEAEKAGLASEDEVTRLRTKVKLMLDAAKANVRDKQIALQASEAGDKYDRENAQMELKLALAQQKNVTAEARRMVDDYRQAKALKEDEIEETMERMREEDEKKAEIAKKQAEAARAEGEIRKRYGEAIRRIEDQIVAKRGEAARLEANAARARGVGFGDWARGERDIAREERAEERRQANRERSVDDEIARLEKQSPRFRTKWQRDRLAQLKTWKANQDPGNNPALKEAAALEQKRDELLREQNSKLDKIATLLEAATTL